MERSTGSRETWWPLSHLSTSWAWCLAVARHRTCPWSPRHRVGAGASTIASRLRRHHACAISNADPAACAWSHDGLRPPMPPWRPWTMPHANPYGRGRECRCPGGCSWMGLGALGLGCPPRKVQFKPFPKAGSFLAFNLGPAGVDPCSMPRRCDSVGCKTKPGPSVAMGQTVPHQKGVFCGEQLHGSSAALKTKPAVRAKRVPFLFCFEHVRHKCMAFCDDFPRGPNWVIDQFTQIARRTVPTSCRGKHPLHGLGFP